jgi:hypothetical protein
MAITEIPTDSRCGCLWVGETGLFVQQDFSAEGLTLREVAIEVDA